MKRIALLVLVAAGTVAAQDDVDPARKLLDELTARFKGAKTLDIVVESEQPLEDDQVMKVSSEVHIAKPLYGSFRVKAVRADEPFDMEVVGTGEKLFLLNHVDKTIQPGPAEWQNFFSMYLMRTWGAGAPEVDGVTLTEADGLRRLAIEWGGQTETLVVDKEGRIVAGEARGPGPLVKHVFKRFEARSDVDPKTYAAKIPDGYATFDPFAEMNASLLEVGAAAPDVSVTGMDDKVMKLADLKGKTVVLNFWFFH